jgi:hypothetical protein
MHRVAAVVDGVVGSDRQARTERPQKAFSEKTGNHW